MYGGERGGGGGRWEAQGHVGRKHEDGGLSDEGEGEGGMKGKCGRRGWEWERSEKIKAMLGDKQGEKIHFNNEDFLDVGERMG